jgi:hypothetical protein
MQRAIARQAEAANIMSISCSHPSSVSSDLNEGFGREKLNDDPSSPNRLTHSILAG